MNAESKSQNNPVNFKVKYAVVVVFILLMIATAGQFLYALLSYDKFYNGIHIAGFDVSGLSRDEANDLIGKHYREKTDALKFTIEADGQKESFSFADIEVEFKVRDAIDAAFAVGREGDLFERVYGIYLARKNGMFIDVPVSFNRKKLEDRIQSLYDRILVKVKETDVLIGEDRVIARSGHHGKSIDKDFIYNEVIKSLKSAEDIAIKAPIIITPPGKVNEEDLYNQINREPVDATVKVEGNTVSVIPHIMGRKIEKSQLALIAERLNNEENIELPIPVQFIEPEFTTDEVSALLFRDTLSTFSTAFSTSDENNKNRAENIKIASSKINGTIIAAGEEFSFNKVVGQRTEKEGYKPAHTYVQGKIVDGIGGGICQVSSTLYNAVLLSDLDVVERRNHMFTVGYVPKGRDATVSYNGVDFRFRNSTRWPIKISSWVTKDNKIHFSILGTNEYPGKKVEIVSTVKKTTEFKTVYIDDPNLPEGKTKVKQNGMTGYVVDTYKIVKQDGKTVSNVKLHTSTYKPLDEEVLRGTKKIEPSETQPLPTEKELSPPAVPHTTGVDDADNPPAEE